MPSSFFIKFGGGRLSNTWKRNTNWERLKALTMVILPIGVRSLWDQKWRFRFNRESFGVQFKWNSLFLSCVKLIPKNVIGPNDHLRLNKSWKQGRSLTSFPREKRWDFSKFTFSPEDDLKTWRIYERFLLMTQSYHSGIKWYHQRTEWFWPPYYKC